MFGQEYSSTGIHWIAPKHDAPAPPLSVSDASTPCHLSSPSHNLSDTANYPSDPEHPKNHVMAPAAFDTKAQLQLALDHAAWAEALFGTSDLSPLTTPECTPPPSPTLNPASATDVEDLDIGTSEPSDAIGHNPSAQSTGTQSTSRKDRRKVKKKLQGHANRSKRRQEARDASYANLKPRTQRTVDILGASDPLRTNIDSSKSSYVSTGFTGLDNRDCQKKLYNLEELVGEGSKFGFKLHAWDGR